MTWFCGVSGLVLCLRYEGSAVTLVNKSSQHVAYDVFEFFKMSL